MREIISPIGNPDRKWNKIATFHLSVRIRGSKRELTATKVKDKFWAGSVECYQLEQKSVASPVCKVLCNVLSVFGKEAALQE